MTKDQINNDIGNIFLDVVIVSQYINRTAAAGSQDPLGKYMTRFRQSLSQITYMKTYNILQNSLSLYNNPYDSNLFNADTKREYDYYSTTLADITFFNSSIEHFSSLGYFNLKFQQSEHKINQVWHIATIPGIIANIGGYAGSITQIVALVLCVYQQFMFESSLIKRLFKEKKVNSTSKDGNDNNEDSKVTPIGEESKEEEGRLKGFSDKSHDFSGIAQYEGSD